LGYSKFLYYIVRAFGNYRFWQILGFSLSCFERFWLKIVITYWRVTPGKPTPPPQSIKIHVIIRRKSTSLKILTLCFMTVCTFISINPLHNLLFFNSVFWDFLKFDFRLLVIFSKHIFPNIFSKHILLSQCIVNTNTGEWDQYWYWPSPYTVSADIDAETSREKKTIGVN